MTAGKRLDLRTLSPHAAPSTFASDVRSGLTAARKTLPPKYFYDALGSKLFEAICLLPEYYLTRTERANLGEFATEVAALLDGSVELIELGSGNAEKTRLIVDAMLAKQPSVHYTMVDISPEALEGAADALLDAYPSMTITAYAGDYMGGLAAIAADSERRADRRLALFLGSNIGNLDNASAVALLVALRAAMKPGDAVLLGMDFKKDRALLEAAYDDPLGVTAAFNLNLLSRMNRELGADFDVQRFRHRATYDESDGCVRMELVSLAEQTVAIRSIGLTVAFAEGETIHTEDSRKYDDIAVNRLAAESGFSVARTLVHATHLFASVLLTAVA